MHIRTSDKVGDVGLFRAQDHEALGVFDCLRRHHGIIGWLESTVEHSVGYKLNGSVDSTSTWDGASLVAVEGFANTWWRNRWFWIEELWRVNGKARTTEVQYSICAYVGRCFWSFGAVGEFDAGLVVFWTSYLLVCIMFRKYDVPGLLRLTHIYRVHTVNHLVINIDSQAGGKVDSRVWWIWNFWSR